MKKELLPIYPKKLSLLRFLWIGVIFSPFYIPFTFAVVCVYLGFLALLKHLLGFDTKLLAPFIQYPVLFALGFLFWLKFVYRRYLEDRNYDFYKEKPGAVNHTFIRSKGYKNTFKLYGKIKESKARLKSALNKARPDDSKIEKIITLSFYTLLFTLIFVILCVIVGAIWWSIVEGFWAFINLFKTNTSDLSDLALVCSVFLPVALMCFTATLRVIFDEIIKAPATLTNELSKKSSLKDDLKQALELILKFAGLVLLNCLTLILALALMSAALWAILNLIYFVIACFNDSKFHFALYQPYLLGIFMVIIGFVLAYTIAQDFSQDMRKLLAADPKDGALTLVTKRALNSLRVIFKLVLIILIAIIVFAVLSALWALMLSACFAITLFFNIEVAYQAFVNYESVLIPVAFFVSLGALNSCFEECAKTKIIKPLADLKAIFLTFWYMFISSLGLIYGLVLTGAVMGIVAAIL